MSDKLEIVYKKTSTLKRYAKNSRTHSKEQVNQIAESISEFGFTNPILINSQTIIAGHGRLEAAKIVGLEELPTINLSHLDEVQIKALVIADNQLALNAGWDLEILKTEIDSLKLEDFDVDLLGFDDDFLNNILEPETVEGLTDENDVPETPVDPITVAGDLWILGNHRLLCGDSTSIDAVEKLMDGQKADMVFTDPPYGVDYDGGHNKKKRSGIIADNLEGDNLTDLFYGALTTAITATKDGAAFYVWFASGKSIETFASLSKLPLEIRAVIQWYKVKSGLGAFMSQYIPNNEPCMYLYKTGCSPAWYGASDEKTVWELKKESRNEYHPTQKPVELPERALTNSSKSGDYVLDLFGGSGSTMIASEKINRHSRLMELDPKYCDVIISRWQEFTGSKAVHENGQLFDDMKKNKAGD